MNENQNENQEKNSLEEETMASEPFFKRAAKFSAFIYLGLAIMVVVIATVGIFSISYDYEDELPSISIPELGLDTEISLPQITVKPDYSDELPVGGDESGVDADVTVPDVSKPTVSVDESEPEVEDDPQAPKQKYRRPVSGEIQKSFSMDNLVFSETMRDYRVHTGIDIAAELGSEVIAFADGVVASISEDYFYGMTVSVAHPDGSVSYYMNLDKTLAPNIAVGKNVSAGQALGSVGDTARIESAEEPHLHFEIRINNELVNPEVDLP